MTEPNSNFYNARDKWALKKKKRTKHKLANTEKERRDAGKEGRKSEQPYQSRCRKIMHYNTITL